MNNQEPIEPLKDENNSMFLIWWSIFCIMSAIVLAVKSGEVVGSIFAWIGIYVFVIFIAALFKYGR